MPIVLLSLPHILQRIRSTTVYETFTLRCCERFETLISNVDY